MFCKRYCFLLFFCLIKAESNFKKSLHYYCGLCKFIRQAPTTQIQMHKIEEGKKTDAENQEDDQKEISKGKKDNVINFQLPIFFDSEAKEAYSILLKNAIIQSKDNIVYNHGAIFSLYLGEFLDVFSFGLCVSHENRTDDSIYYNPTTERMENYVKNNNEANNSNNNDNKNLEEKSNLKGILFFNRNSPIMLGGFFQIQNDDLDSYSFGAKISLMIGYLKVYGLSKELQTFCNDGLMNNNQILLKTTITLNLTFAILFKFQDIELSVLCGLSWAPMGIKFKQKGIVHENQNEEDMDHFSEIEVKTNHLNAFVGISIGFSFD